MAYPGIQFTFQATQTLPQRPNTAVSALVLPKSVAADSVLNQRFISLQDLENAGITAAWDTTNSVNLHEQAARYWAMNPGAPLWIYTQTDNLAPNEADVVAMIDAVQTEAAGEVFQFGIMAGLTNSTAIGDSATGFDSFATAIAAKCEDLTANNTPCMAVIECADFYPAGGEAQEITTANNLRFVTPCVVADQYGEDYTAPTWNSAAIGTMLGAISKAAVHESIAWKRRFPLSDGTRFTKAYYSGGQPWKDVTRSERVTLDSNQIPIVDQYTGLAGIYFTRDWTLGDTATAENYTRISRVRAAQLAQRVVYARLAPDQSMPLYLNPDGTLRGDTVGKLFGAVDAALSANLLQEGNESLSSYQIDIPDTQNVSQQGYVKINLNLQYVGVADRYEIPLTIAANL